MFIFHDFIMLDEKLSLGCKDFSSVTLLSQQIVWCKNIVRTYQCWRLIISGNGKISFFEDQNDNKSENETPNFVGNNNSQI